MMVKAMGMENEKYNNVIYTSVLLHEKFLQFDWLRAVVFQLYFSNSLIIHKENTKKINV